MKLGGKMEKRLYDYELDENLEIYLMIESCDVRIAKNGKKFLALTFQDKSGKMDGKFWDASESDIEMFQPGIVVLVKGKRELYQGNPQLKIFTLHPSDDAAHKNLESFVETAPENIEDIKEEFNQFVFHIINPTMNRIVRYLLNKYQEEYFVRPAAKKLHHAYRGGLAYHTVSILRLAQGVVNQYKDMDASLLYSGAIIHDIGKVRELTGPINTEYTLEGNLVGHIVIANEEVSKACQALKIDESKEDVLLLKHMVLSHHGLLEYGSPVRPRILEAEILHHLDHLDASITQVSDALGRTQAGEFGERLFGMDNRSFYKPNKPHQKQ